MIDLCVQPPEREAVFHPNQALIDVPAHRLKFLLEAHTTTECVKHVRRRAGHCHVVHIDKRRPQKCLEFPGPQVVIL
jgi:hypothetical protein